MAELQKAREAQARPGGIADDKTLLRGRKAGEVAVGGGQHDDFAGALAKIDGLCAVADRAGKGGEKVHRLDNQCRGDRGTVDAFAADHHEARGANLVVAPRPVEILREPRSHRLHHLAERLAGDVEEALDA